MWVVHRKLHTGNLAINLFFNIVSGESRLQNSIQLFNSHKQQLRKEGVWSRLQWIGIGLQKATHEKL